MVSLIKGKKKPAKWVTIQCDLITKKLLTFESAFHNIFLYKREMASLLSVSKVKVLWNWWTRERERGSGNMKIMIRINFVLSKNHKTFFFSQQLEEARQIIKYIIRSEFMVSIEELYNYGKKWFPWSKIIFSLILHRYARKAKRNSPHYFIDLTNDL
jgi:hypothetical protein